MEIEETDNYNQKFIKNYLDRLFPFHMDRDEIYNIQKEMIFDIIGTENQIVEISKKYKAEREIALKSLKEYKKRSKKRKEINQRIELLDRAFKKRIGICKERLNLLRLCGDTIVWNLFERDWIRNMYQHQQVGYLHNNAGLEFEVESFDSVYHSNEDSVPIFHDITNILQLGDITILMPYSKPAVIECKSITTDELILTERLGKQAQKAVRFSEYIGSGREEIKTSGTNGDNESFIREILSLDIKERYNWKIFENLMSKSSEEGYSSEVIDDCLLYIAIDLKKCSINEVIEEILIEQNILKGNIWTGCINRSFEDLHEFRPITTFDIDRSILDDILFRRKTFFCTILFDSLENIFKKRDMKTNFNLRKDIIEVRNQTGITLQLGDYSLGRVIYELLSLDTFFEYTYESLKYFKNKLKNEVA